MHRYYNNLRHEGGGQTKSLKRYIRSMKIEKTLSERLAEKALNACVSAIEVYNKPLQHYREELFSILMVNAFEVLLKAILVKNDNENIDCIYDKKAGKVELNRSGNQKTISIFRSVEKVSGLAAYKIDSNFKNNLEAIVNIRDEAIHFISQNATLSESVYSIASSSIKNFVELYGYDFEMKKENYNFFLLPLSFYSLKESTMINPPEEVMNVVSFLREQSQGQLPEEESPYAVSIVIEAKILRNNHTDGLKFVPVKEGSTEDSGDLVKVVMKEEDFMQRYPWDYKELCNRCRSRYSNFKMSKEWHAVRKSHYDDERYCHKRYQDPKKKSHPKVFFSPNILNVLDDVYSRK